MALVQYEPADDDPFQRQGTFFAYIRTSCEVSLVVEEPFIPAGARKVSRGWRIFEVKGPFALDSIGVLSSIATPLAAANVSLFALATYNTDYFLVQDGHLNTAAGALRAAGHNVVGMD
jgi:uncharacterized protein